MGVETSPTPARYVISLSVHDNMPRQSFCSWHGLHTERTLNDMLCRYYIPAAPLSDFIEDFWLYNDYRPAGASQGADPAERDDRAGHQPPGQRVARLRSRATRPLRALLRGDRLRNLRRVLRDRHPRRPRDIVGSVSSRASRPAPDRDRSDRQVPRPGSGAPRASVWFRHTSRCGALCPPRVRRIQSHHRPRRQRACWSEPAEVQRGLQDRGRSHTKAAPPSAAVSAGPRTISSHSPASAPQSVSDINRPFSDGAYT